ncbi:MAG: hypothetical protein AMXMBFR51_30410 [Ignavibacteriota bacterium]
MELLELKKKIIDSFKGSDESLKEILQIIENDRSIFPFNEYEHLICNFIEKRGLSFSDYLNIRAEYISANPNLWIFEISAPRGFGEKFAQTYVQGKCSLLQSPNRNLDPNYRGDYDLLLDNIRIEVKASRAVDKDSEEPLYMKALSRNTKKNFLMNFQQLKPQCCDVFIWVAVFRDQIILWVMSSYEVTSHPDFSKGQHRGNIGNEGQLHITKANIETLSQYELIGDDLKKAINKAAKRNKKSPKRK